MKSTLAIVLLGLLVLPLRAEDWTTTDGKTYRNVQVVSHNAAYVTILDEDGGARLKLSKLGPEFAEAVWLRSGDGARDRGGDKGGGPARQGSGGAGERPDARGAGSGGGAHEGYFGCDGGGGIHSTSHVCTSSAGCDYRFERGPER